jgi:signal peptidase II
MKYSKLITISFLPIIWTIYFLFELITGRIENSNILIGNIILIILFSFIGYLIYSLSSKFPKGLTSKQTISTFFILMFLDQGIKSIINNLYFNKYFEIINDFLSFSPIINSKGSWLNARFGTGISFSLLNIINILALLFFLELYRYTLSKKEKSFFNDMCFLFIFSGALCSLIDKLFYGGSLDFIGISNLFVADIKDIYINIGILFFSVTIYNSGYLTTNNDTTLKEDLKSIQSFLSFIKQDLLKIKGTK